MTGVADPPAGDRAVTEAPRRRWGLGDVLAGYLVGFLLAGVLGQLWRAVTGDDTSLGVAAATMAGLWTGMVGATLLASRRKGEGNLRADVGLELRPRDVPVGVVAGLASQYLLVPLVYLPWRLADEGFDRRLEEPARRVTELADGPGFGVLALLVVLGAPIVEELFFRGLLQRSLSARFGAPLAVAGSALAFGLDHYQPLQLLGLAAFGVVLGLLAWRSGRLGPALVAHVVFNLATVVTLARA